PGDVGPGKAVRPARSAAATGSAGLLYDVPACGRVWRAPGRQGLSGDWRQRREHPQGVQDRVEGSVGEYPDIDVAFPGHDVDEREDGDGSGQVLPGRGEVVQGEEQRVDQG